MWYFHKDCGKVTDRTDCHFLFCRIVVKLITELKISFYRKGEICHGKQNCIK